jgi:mannose-6-phosphate isomerase-like protein (cupin superfamily)
VSNPRPDGDPKIVSMCGSTFPAPLHEVPPPFTGTLFPKGWGHEEWIWNSPNFCGKLLVFKPNKRCSYHYHKLKFEVFRVIKGSFVLYAGWTDNIEEAQKIDLNVGDSYPIPLNLRHQMIAGPFGGTIMEVSTEHFELDSYRIFKGD